MKTQHGNHLRAESDHYDMIVISKILQWYMSSTAASFRFRKLHVIEATTPWSYRSGVLGMDQRGFVRIHVIIDECARLGVSVAALKFPRRR